MRPVPLGYRRWARVLQCRLYGTATKRARLLFWTVATVVSYSEDYISAIGTVPIIMSKRGMFVLGWAHWEPFIPQTSWRIWLSVCFIHLRVPLVGVSSSFYYKYLNTFYVSAQLAIFRCTIMFLCLLMLLLLPGVFLRLALCRHVHSVFTVFGGQIFCLVSMWCSLGMFVFFLRCDRSSWLLLRKQISFPNLFWRFSRWGTVSKINSCWLWHAIGRT
jgi:hypothetical protein